MSTSKIRQKSAGFTLLEVLVAFAILSIALMAVYRAFQSGIQHERLAAEAAIRVLEARSIMDAHMVIGEVEIAEGVLSTGERWRLETVAVAPPDESGWAVPVHRLTLTAGRGEAEVLRLVTVRLGH